MGFPQSLGESGQPPDKAPTAEQRASGSGWDRSALFRLALLWLIGANLRMAVLALPPLLPEIQHQLGLERDRRRCADQPPRVAAGSRGGPRVHRGRPPRAPPSPRPRAAGGRSGFRARGAWRGRRLVRRERCPRPWDRSPAANYAKHRQCVVPFQGVLCHEPVQQRHCDR